jgi:hypothetical protein
MTGDDVWNAAVRIAAIVTLPSLPYLVYDRRRRLPSFRFIFSGFKPADFPARQPDVRRDDFQRFDSKSVT